MALKKYKQVEENANIVNDDGGAYNAWKAGEDRDREESLKLNHTERFKIMMRLMRMDMMLKNAKVTHKKFPQ